MSNQDVVTRCGQLLSKVGRTGSFQLGPLAGGANNQVFRVDSRDGPLLFKVYYRHPDDPRDRLRADYGFSSFAWNCGVRALPRPIAADAANGLALFEFIEGRKLRGEEVTAEVVGQALEFYLAVNRFSGNDAARDLPIASEACFSLEAHLAVVSRRLARLRCIEPRGELDAAAVDLVRYHFEPLAEAVFAFVATEAGRQGISLDSVLPEEERCLSPSDFGFHNALLTADGSLRFLDFEYAGWDDPAKMVADFFCQPECPAPEYLIERFAEIATAERPRAEVQRWRCRTLLPVYRLKWCCIMLNDFLPTANHRRRFARGDVKDEERKSKQLLKARAGLAKIWPGRAGSTAA